MHTEWKTAYISLLQVASSLAVVAIHVNIAYFSNDVSEGQWPSALVLHYICYFGVTVFFMLTGATLLTFSDRYTLPVYWKKRISKTLLPYVFWSLAAVLVRLFVLHSLKPAEVTPGFLLRGLLQGSLLSVYWFFIPLFCAYLCIPLFAAVDREKRKAVFIYLAVGGFLVNCAWPFLCREGLNLQTTLELPVAANYLLPVLIGWLLHSCELKKRTALLCEAAGLAALIWLIYRTWADSMAAGKLVSHYKGYWNMLPLLYGVGVFVFFRRYGERMMGIPAVGKLVRALQPYTFSVYLLHFYVVKLAEYLAGRAHVATDGIAYMLLVPPAVYLVSCCLAYCIRKLPFGRYVLP